RPPAVECPQLVADPAALADEQGAGAAGVDSDLEALARLGVETVPAPAGEPRQQRQVRRARDREQLGRPLDDAERGRSTAAQGLGVGSQPLPARRRRITRYAT